MTKIKDHFVTLVSSFYYDGKLVPHPEAHLPEGRRRLENRQRNFKLLDVYEQIKYVIRYYPYLVTGVTRDMFVLVKFPRINSWTEIAVEVRGELRRVKAEKEAMTITGTPEDIKVLHEYLYWESLVSGDKLLPGGFFNPSCPSAIPMFALFDEYNRTPAESALLAHYGLTSEEVEFLIRRFIKHTAWFDVVEVNEKWFDDPEKSFSEMLRDHGVLPVRAL